jgi:anionic cell wall polymer biosynthesis LytR-Cps2A-Psr (LCP) family protein
MSNLVEINSTMLNIYKDLTNQKHTFLHMSEEDEDDCFDSLYTVILIQLNNSTYKFQFLDFMHDSILYLECLWSANK